jgi:chromosomal replication initiator protein
VNAKQLWQTALERVRTRVSGASYTTWFKATEGIDAYPGELVVAAPNSFACEHLRQRFHDVAVDAASEALGQSLNVRFVVSGPARPHEVPDGSREAAPSISALAPRAAHTDAPVAMPIRQTVAPRRRVARLPRSSGEHHERRAVLDAPRASRTSGDRHAAPPVAQPALLALTESLPAASSVAPPRLSPASATPALAPTAARYAVPARPLVPRSYPFADPDVGARQVFETYIAGTANRLAFTAAQQIAATPGQSYNPLFIYGGTGLGKTHLLLAIGHVVRARGLAVCYVAAERFANDMIEAIRHHTTNEFRAQYREVDVLLVDDIQFIAGKEATEEEFFHTFNALHDINRQIVLTSDRPPKAMRHLHDRLRSRFEWGLLADIQPPDEAHRLAILRAKAEQLAIAASETVLAELARAECASIRELEGALNRVAAYAHMLKQPLDVAMVGRALSPLRAPRQSAVSGDAILRVVASHFGVTLEALRGKGRDQRVAWSRQVAMYLLREETAASLAQIGQQLGGRDHTTIMHGCAHVARELTADTPTRRELNELRGALRA